MRPFLQYCFFAAAFVETALTAGCVSHRSSANTSNAEGVKPGKNTVQTCSVTGAEKGIQLTLLTTPEGQLIRMDDSNKKTAAASPSKKSNEKVSVETVILANGTIGQLIRAQDRQAVWWDDVSVRSLDLFRKIHSFWTASYPHSPAAEWLKKNVVVASGTGGLSAGSAAPVSSPMSGSFVFMPIYTDADNTQITFQVLARVSNSFGEGMIYLPSAKDQKWLSLPVQVEVLSSTDEQFRLAQADWFRTDILPKSFEWIERTDQKRHIGLRCGAAQATAEKMPARTATRNVDPATSKRLTTMNESALAALPISLAATAMAGQFKTDGAGLSSSQTAKGSPKSQAAQASKENKIPKISNPPQGPIQKDNVLVNFTLGYQLRCSEFSMELDRMKRQKGPQPDLDTVVEGMTRFFTQNPHEYTWIKKLVQSLQALGYTEESGVPLLAQSAWDGCIKPIYPQLLRPADGPSSIQAMHLLAPFRALWASEALGASLVAKAE